MSEFSFLDNGFCMLKEDTHYASPISTIFYEHYNDMNSLYKKLIGDREQLQCIVSQGFMDDEIMFGNTQSPDLTEYADGADTVEFLLKT